MTPEAQRIAISEALGAQIITKRFEDGSDGRRRFGRKWAWDGNEVTSCAHPGGGFFGWGWNEKAHVDQLPDFLSDLNACHEMAAAMKYKELERMHKHFAEIMARDQNGPRHPARYRAATLRSFPARKRSMDRLIW